MVYAGAAIVILCTGYAVLKSSQPCHMDHAPRLPLTKPEPAVHSWQWHLDNAEKHPRIIELRKRQEEQRIQWEKDEQERRDYIFKLNGVTRKRN
jgi:hypothetical protein